MIPGRGGKQEDVSESNNQSLTLWLFANHPYWDQPAVSISILYSGGGGWGVVPGMRIYWLPLLLVPRSGESFRNICWSKNSSRISLARAASSITIGPPVLTWGIIILFLCFYDYVFVGRPADGDSLQGDFWLAVEGDPAGEDGQIISQGVRLKATETEWA